MQAFSHRQGIWLTAPLGLAKIDFGPAHRQPATSRIVLATVLALVGSVAAVGLLAMTGTALFPELKGYSHFQFADYAKLTIIGVVIACAAWPVVTWISSSPRWLFLRSAVLFTLVLLLPDVYIYWLGQPAKAVAVLVVMHLAIALVTYNVLVHVAPVRLDRARTQGPSMLGSPNI